MSYQASIPIAIIGIGCRLPGNVTDTETLWDLLVQGKSAWSPAPADRYNETAFYHPKPDNNGTTNHWGGHFLNEDVAAFDAAFFGISPVEAQAMDPQQRLLLEVSYEAFENAGIPIENVRGSDTAVFAAIFTKDYDRNLYKDTSDLPKYHTTGTGEAIVSNRISYTFHLNGPSMTIDTGCSGSMVALHQACQSIRTRETSMALACGVSLILNPDQMIGMSNLGMLNSDGRSYSFDARGSGYGRGEGVSAVLLKRLDDAIGAGDNVRAIIRSSGVNQDGKTNGITLPSQQAQEALMRSVYEEAGLDPHKISYVEAHGTGTSAGDLVELQSIAKVFCGDKIRQSKLYIGSVKSNIGHLESSSGLAGLIKTVIILEKGLIPSNADFQSRKESLKLEEWNMIVPTALEPWPVDGKMRQASVNSFGYGGTNAHIILESCSNNVVTKGLRERSSSKYAIGARVGKLQSLAKEGHEGDGARHDEPSANGPLHANLGSSTKSQLFVITAKSELSALELAAKLKEWATVHPEFKDYSENLAYSLVRRRFILQWRYCFVAGCHMEVLAALNSKKLRPIKALENRQATFVFTGQGAQWFAMGRELMNTHSAFSTSLIESDTMLRDLGSSWSLLDELQRNETSSRVHEGEIAQPASTALQIALFDLLTSFRVEPRIVLGHSSGEIAAAYAAGVLTHEVALRVSYCRSFVPRICKEAFPTPGAMISVGIGEQEITQLITNLTEGTLSVACVNSPSNTTLSGDESAILEIQRTLNKMDIFNRRLKVDTAYHSHHMQEVAQQYSFKLGTIPTQQKHEEVIFLSSVTGKEKTHDFGAAYWVENLVSKVRFCDAIQEWSRTQGTGVHVIGSKLTHTIVEIGPHSVLGGSIQQTIPKDLGTCDYEYFSTLVRGRDANHSMLELVGKLFERGYPIDVANANSLKSSHSSLRVIQGLPTYPWDHSNTYWHESRLSRDYRMRHHPPHDLLGVRVPSSTPLEPSWRHIISLDALPWLKDHVIDGLVVFPGSGYLCMAVEAVRQMTCSNDADKAIKKLVLQQISFSKALVVPSAPLKTELLINLRSQTSIETTWYEFKIFALSPEEAWHQHCSGRITVDSSSKSPPVIGLVAEPGDRDGLSRSPLDHTLLGDCPQDIFPQDLYSQLRSCGNDYGPSFATMTNLRMGKGQATGHVRIPDVQSVMPMTYQQPHLIHPTTLDALMHSVLPLYAQDHRPGSIMPVSIHEITISADIPSNPGEKLLVATSISSSRLGAAKADISIFARNGEPQEEVLTISQLEIIGLAPPENRDGDSLTKPNIMYQMNFAPDIDFISSSNSTNPEQISVPNYFKLLSFKYSQVAVLEVGASAGQSTLETIHALQGNGLNPLVRYDFTDLTSESFKDAQMLLQEWEGVMRYRVFNVHINPLEQGFDGACYDLIIVHDVFPSDCDLSAMLTNIRALLKPRGRLVIDFPHDCSASRANLQAIVVGDLLNTAGLCYESTLDDRPARTVVSSRVAQAQRCIEITSISLIVARGLESFASLLDSALKDHGFVTNLTDWDSCDFNAKANYILLEDGARPYLSNLTQERFSKVVRLLGSQSTVFWIMAQHDVGAITNPEKGLAIGLIRSALAENENLKVVTFDIQDNVVRCSTGVTQRIVDILSIHAGKLTDIQLPHEHEYIYRDGRLLISRLLPIKEINAMLGQASTMSTVRKPYLLSQYCLNTDRDTIPGTESFCFVENEPKQAPPAVGEIEIAVNVHSLSPLDPRELSSAKTVPVVHELAGVICAAGSDVLQEHSTGDRVCAWFFGGPPLPSRVRVNADCIAHLPNSMPFVMGAALPLAAMAAYYALYRLARLRKGQILLVNGADSDVGQAAIVIARHIGSQVIAITSDTTKRDEFAKRDDINLTRFFATTDSFIAQKVLDCTGGQGADVILNAQNSDSLFNISACVAVLGTIVQLGNPWNSAGAPNRCSLAEKTAIFVTLDLPNLIRDRPLEAKGLLSNSMAILGPSDPIALHTVTEMSIAEVKDAFRQLRGRKRFEKLLLTADDSTYVNVFNIGGGELQTTRHTLDSNGAYVVAGGLGDLGRKICRLMAQRGAKTLVTLSRKAIGVNDHQVMEKQLQEMSPGLRFVSLACDISKKSSVDEAVRRMRKLSLPRVKGIFQSATVLKDGILDRITFDDFQVPLQTKLYGTHHLSEAFQDASPDFFVMLSSLSGVVGSRGQSNYAAGNTFQDALAHTRSNSKTHYMALNLGMVEGTDAYENSVGRARIKNLHRQGWTPIKNEELLTLLDYAMSPLARDHSCHQAAIGIDGKSIHEADSSTPIMKSAMFTHVRATYRWVDTGINSSVDRSVRERIEIAEDPATVPQIISEAVSQRLSRITMLDPKNIDLETPIIDLGLDSLTAVELKNWTQKEMEAPVQASEILDAQSINALSLKLAARSTLIQGNESLASSQDGAVGTGSSPVGETQFTSRPYLSGKPSNKDTPSTLPRLPLPQLNHTLELYLKSAQPFLSDNENEATSFFIQEFRERSGQKLQERLSARCQDPEIDSWQHDLQVRAVYLSRRDPIHPYGTFYGSHPKSDLQHRQAERAAIISAAAYKFKQRLDAGHIEQDNLNEEPLSMDSLKWLFNASREPRIDLDIVAKYPGNNYLVALRRGYVYKIMLERNDCEESYLTLKCQFEAVLEHSVDTLPSVASLSADERDSWAKVQDSVASLSADNKLLINMINAAVFVVCLDDGAPAIASERSNQLLLGDPGNRWSDKTLQFVVCANGASGFVCEHSMLDAASLKQLNQSVTHAVVEHKFDQPCDVQVNGHSNTVDTYTFTTDAKILKHIARVHEDFARRHTPVEVSHFRLPAIGSNLLHTHKVPSKASLQVIIQLASVLYFRSQHPSWETVTMMPFHKGRLDWMQVVSTEMYEFCKAAADERTARADLPRLLRDATQSHASTLTKIARGRGFAAHLEALREVVQKDETVPELFKDPTWEMMRVTSTRKIKTDASEGLMAPEAGFYMPDPESMLVHYEIEDEGCKFFIQSTEGRTSPFCEALEKAATVVKGILEK